MPNSPIRSVIHRIELPIADQTDVVIRGYRKAISVAPHRHHPDEQLEVWFERYVQAGPNDEMTVRFHIHGTGHEFDHDTTPFGNLGTLFLGSVQTHGGQLVWHVYAEYPIGAGNA